MAMRLVAAALTGVGVAELLSLALRALLGSVSPGMLDPVLGGVGAAGAALLAVNRVTDRSAGAVDNAAGVVSPPATGGGVPPGAPGGGILPGARGYGFLGARGPGRGGGPPLAG